MMMSNGNFGGGDGSKGNPFLVEDAADLDAVRNGLELHYRQTKDIDLSNYTNWIPIRSEEGVFSGVYDGNQRIIKGLKITTSESRAGLFGHAIAAEFHDVRLINVDVEGVFNTGGLAGAAGNTIISGCSVSGSVTSDNTQVGGLVGSFTGSCVASSASCHVEGMRSVGGVFGSTGNTTSIVDVFSEGTVKVGLVGEGGDVGGLIGMATFTTIERCYSVSEVYHSGDAGGVGGLVGTFMSFGEVLQDSYALNPIIQADGSGRIFAGAVLGQNAFGGPVRNCFSLPTIQSNVPLDNIGTIVMTEDAKTREHYEDNGWDFETVWDIREGESYPFFKTLTKSRTKCRRMPLSGFLKF